MQTKAYTMVSTRKEVAGTNRAKGTAAIGRPTTHHQEGIHADAREDGWERTYANNERRCDAEGWASDTDGERWAVDGVVLLFYDDLLTSLWGGLRGGTGVERWWRGFTVDVGVVSDVGEPRLAERRSTRH
jgi:hypothetical protein